MQHLDADGNPTVGGASVASRVIRCQLPAGHDGEHEYA